MRRIWISALVIVTSLALAPAAWAGKAHSGQVSPGKSSVLSKAAQKLVGTWRMVAFDFAGKRRPFPARRAPVITLRGDGSLSMKDLPQGKKLSKSRWNVKAGYVVLTNGKKVQKLKYSHKGSELSVAMPGKTRVRIILQRLSKKPMPRP